MSLSGNLTFTLSHKINLELILNLKKNRCFITAKHSSKITDVKLVKYLPNIAKNIKLQLKTIKNIGH